MVSYLFKDTNYPHIWHYQVAIVELIIVERPSFTRGQCVRAPEPESGEQIKAGETA